jgi:hypothetical protein
MERAEVAAFRRSRGALTSPFGSSATRGANESGTQSHLRRRRSAIRRCLGEREEKRLLQEREVCAGAAGGEQLSQLAGLGAGEGDRRLRAKAALEKE